MQFNCKNHTSLEPLRLTPLTEYVLLARESGKVKTATADVGLKPQNNGVSMRRLAHEQMVALPLPRRISNELALFIGTHARLV